MPFFAQCPFCQHRFSLPFTVVVTGCPNCRKTFSVDHLAEGFSWQAAPSATEKVSASAEHKASAGIPATDVDEVNKGLTPPALQNVPTISPVPDLPEPILPEFAAPPEHMNPAPAPVSPPILPEPLPIHDASPPPATNRENVKPMPRTTSIPAAPQARPGEDDEEAAELSWINPWGLAALALAVLGLLLASVVGVRMLTIGLAALGMMAVVLGIWSGRSNQQTEGRAMLAGGGAISATVLLLALIVPGVINSRWAMDFSVPRSDPNKQVVVPRDHPRHEGRPLSEGEWADAVKDAIRQDDVFVRLEAVQVDRLPDKGDNKYLLVYVRLGNSGHERTIAVSGFSKDKNQPVLTDDSGLAYRFLEQRPRKALRGRGPVEFEVSGPKMRELAATVVLDQLLVFEAPSAKVGPLKLELPASAWSRTGVCKFHAPGLFDARIDIKKGRP